MKLQKYTPKHITEKKENKAQQATKVAIMTGTTASVLLSQNVTAFATEKAPIVQKEEGLPSIYDFLTIPKANGFLNPAEAQEVKEAKEEVKFTQTEETKEETEKEAEIEDKIQELTNKKLEELKKQVEEEARKEVLAEIEKEKEVKATQEKKEAVEDIQLTVSELLSSYETLEDSNVKVSVAEDGNIELKIVLNSETPEENETKTEATEEKEEAKAEETPEVFAFDAEKEYGVLKVPNTQENMVASLTKEEVDNLANTMIRPVKNGTYNISSQFGFRTLRGAGEFHRGLDFAGNEETPVYATADGVIVQSGKANGYGNWIVIKHTLNGMTVYSLYGHMYEKDLMVKVGDTVKQGQQITRIGNTGDSTGPHLHFAVALGNENRLYFDFVNPTFTLYNAKSDSFDYQTAPVKEEVQPSTSTASIQDFPYLEEAIKAGEQLGWDPLFIYAQWRLETDNFKSNNFVKNNNIAGQTWFPGCGYEKGTARPSAEGGHYIKYADPVQGYVDFVQKSPRYSGVKEKATPEEQAAEVARAGWATDPAYKDSLTRVIQDNRAKFGDILKANN